MHASFCDDRSHNVWAGSRDRLLSQWDRIVKDRIHEVVGKGGVAGSGVN